MTRQQIDYWESLLKRPIENPCEFGEGLRDAEQGMFYYRGGMGSDYEAAFWRHLSNQFFTGVAYE